MRRKAIAGKRVTFPAETTVSERLYEKNVDPFANLLPEPLELWLSHLDQVDPAGRAKVIVCKKVGPTRKVTLLSKKGYLARRVTIIANPTFCFSCQRFDKFNKEI